MKTINGEEKLLGQFVYNNDGPNFQTFELPGQHTDEVAFKYVRLQVESNWGNTEYTCLYKFRVLPRAPHKLLNQPPNAPVNHRGNVVRHLPFEVYGATCKKKIPVKDILKAIEPGVNIYVTPYCDNGFWGDLCDILDVPNTKTNRQKLHKAVMKEVLKMWKKKDTEFIVSVITTHPGWTLILRHRDFRTLRPNQWLVGENILLLNECDWSPVTRSLLRSLEQEEEKCLM
ncbi:hypothetical protein WMY93_025511 [Mugilogobius chulae]|uniref:SUN domain-containing protein n=1 Tax=Mugilogobius chulae TaxID=88201 RepID=A0AAW0N6P1_9GOBI